MGHGPEHHLEHAEHAAHASHNEFDKRVTMSIAIVAAVLAAITMLGHRSHNETLQLQGEAIVRQAEAGIYHNQAANKWAQYQANNIREHMYEAFLEQTPALATKPESKDALEAAQTRWKQQVAKYKETMPKMRKDAEGFTEKGESHETQAKNLLAESHVTHAKSMRFDLGELGLQMGVVLCSMAILTKQRGFWLTGLLCSAAGLALALTGVLGLFLDGGHH